MITFPGYYGDVFAHPEGIGCLYSIHEQKKLQLRINGVARTTIDIPDNVLYLKAWANPLGIIEWIAQPQTLFGTMYGYINGTQNGNGLFPILCYSRPAVYWDGTQFVFYIQNSPSTWVIKDNNFENQYPIPIWPGGDGTTSQGIWQVLNDGNLVWTDPNRDKKYGNTTILFGCQSNGLVIGQGTENGMIGVGVDGSKPFLAMNFNPMEPRAIYSPVVNKWGCYSWGLGAVGAYNELPPFDYISPVVPDIKPFKNNVNIVIYKDSEGTSGAESEIVVNQKNQVVKRPYFVAEDSTHSHFLGELQGIYTESIDLSVALELAKEKNTRVIYGQDTLLSPFIPVGLRPFDQFWIELYRVVGESLTDCLLRWGNNVDRLLHIWPGDCGLIAMFYTQGGAPPNTVWTVDEVIKGLNYLDYFVNKSDRIKVVAAFSYERANGIIAYPDLQEAWQQLKEATPGPAIYLPIPPQEIKVKSDFTVTELLNLQDVTEVPHPDGKGLVALKTPEGKYKSLNELGQWAADANSAGYFERFFPFGGGWFAYRESTKRTFVVTTRVPALPYE